MNKIETLNSFSRINESKITNEELLDFVHKLGYESIDDIKKEKSKLAKLEALFNELNMSNGQKAKKIDEDDTVTDSDTGSSTGSDEGTDNTATDDTTSSDGSDTSTDDTSSDNGSDEGTDNTATDNTPADDTASTKPKSMHIKSFAEFCGELEEDKEPKVNNDTMNESEIKSDEEFKEYAMNILKKAHPDDFDEEKANKTIEDILKDHNGDYGAAIGALNNGLSK